jgi:hypothetical protein
MRSSFLVGLHFGAIDAAKSLRFIISEQTYIRQANIGWILAGLPSVRVTLFRGNDRSTGFLPFRHSGQAKREPESSLRWQLLRFCLVIEIRARE